MKTLFNHLLTGTPLVKKITVAIALLLAVVVIVAMMVFFICDLPNVFNGTSLVKKITALALSEGLRQRLSDVTHWYATL